MQPLHNFNLAYIHAHASQQHWMLTQGIYKMYACLHHVCLTMHNSKFTMAEKQLCIHQNTV